MPLLGGLNTVAENRSTHAGVHVRTRTHTPIHTPQTGVFGKLKNTTDLPFQSEKATSSSFTPKVSP